MTTTRPERPLSPSPTSWAGPLDPAPDAGWTAPQPRKGFFTDTSVCIGCKACEVACKEWNAVPEDGLQFLGSSYDNSGSLGASTWRHVKFIEQPKSGHPEHDPGMAGTAAGPPATDLLNVAADQALLGDRMALGTDTNKVDLGMPSFELPGRGEGAQRTEFRWLMESDVCKHCTHAACLDVCPTGALFRTEFGTVVVQDDVCNGCGYCVPACPFGVIDRRDGPEGAVGVGGANKCTLCYDRLKGDLTPACAKACPTESIQFGDVDELRERAAQRLATLQGQGVTEARLYGHDEGDGVGGAGAFFLLLDEPEVYGLPPDPLVCTAELPGMWKRAGMAALAFGAAAAAAFLVGDR